MLLSRVLGLGREKWLFAQNELCASRVILQRINTDSNPPTNYLLASIYQQMDIFFALQK